MRLDCLVKQVGGYTGGRESLLPRHPTARPVLLAVGPDPTRPGKCLLVFDPKMSHRF